MNIRKFLRYAMHASKIVAAGLSLYFMATQDKDIEELVENESERRARHKAEDKELDDLERGEVNAAN